MTDTYQCALCEGVFVTDWSDEEAEAEYAENFGDDPDREVVCDDCFKKMTAAWPINKYREETGR